ncbi:MAG: formyltransferase family protein [Thermodesulfobacteriota bacterium]|nr:formyltransferase family protein [Thermodesulfobacteriota bacterium]
MNVLVLGIKQSPLTPVIEESGCRVIETIDPIDTDYLRGHAIDYVVSYRYRHIIKQDLIDFLSAKIINLHISLLPWNKGADPNLWSFLEDTPKGVTIHFIDKGLDTGDIIAQKELFFDPEVETLGSTYENLNSEIVRLFKDVWPRIRVGKAAGIKQLPGGSLHMSKDKERFGYLLEKQGWNTPVKELIGKALIDSNSG